MPKVTQQAIGRAGLRTQLFTELILRPCLPDHHFGDLYDSTMQRLPLSECINIILLVYLRIYNKYFWGVSARAMGPGDTMSKKTENVHFFKALDFSRGRQ